MSGDARHIRLSDASQGLVPRLIEFPRSHFTINSTKSTTTPYRYAAMVGALS